MDRRLVRYSLLVIALFAGCSKPVELPQRLWPETQNSVEPDFATQLAAVRAGQRDRIEIQSEPIGDERLQSLAGADKLEVLLLDYPTNPITQPGFHVIASLPKLMHLRLRGVKVDDEAARTLAGAKSLQIVNLPQSELTDAGLAELTKLPKLVQLRLGSSQLTDKGLESLKSAPSLKRVHLIDVPITDEGLAVFHELPKLESLYIDGAQLSDAAYERLFEAQPGLHVHVDQAHHDRDPHGHPH